MTVQRKAGFTAAAATERTAMGTDEFSDLVGTSIILDDGSGIFQCDSAGASSSVWSALGGGGRAYSRYSIDSNVVGAYGFQWNPVTQLHDVTDRSAEGNDLLAATGNAILGQIGNLQALLLQDTGARVPSTVAGQTNMPTDGDMLIELIINWNGTGNVGGNIVSFHGSAGGDAQIDNTQWSISNSTTGLGLRYFHEHGAGINDLIEFTKLEPPVGDVTIALRRTASTKLVEMFFNGLIVGSGTYPSDPDGGANAHIEFGVVGLTKCAIGDCVISNINRSASEILDRAVATGVVRV